MNKRNLDDVKYDLIESKRSKLILHKDRTPGKLH